MPHKNERVDFLISASLLIFFSSRVQSVQTVASKTRNLTGAPKFIFGWLAKADEWSQWAVDEIALQFREPNGTSFAAAETHKMNADGTHV